MDSLVGLGWVVALVGDRDDLVAQAQGEEELGGVGYQGDDPHDEGG
jgi:hypothetical protein